MITGTPRVRRVRTPYLTSMGVSQQQAGRADRSTDEPHIDKELTWTVEEFFQLL